MVEGLQSFCHSRWCQKRRFQQRQKGFPLPSLTQLRKNPRFPPIFEIQPNNLYFQKLKQNTHFQIYLHKIENLYNLPNSREIPNPLLSMKFMLSLSKYLCELKIFSIMIKNLCALCVQKNLHNLPDQREILKPLRLKMFSIMIKNLCALCVQNISKLN